MFRQSYFPILIVSIVVLFALLTQNTELKASNGVQVHERVRVEPTAQPTSHPDGWDLTFGDGGKLFTGCRSSGNRYTQMQVGPDATIYVSGNCDGQWTLISYLPDGELNTAFGTDGKVTTDYTVATVQPDGKILASNGLQLTRFETDGRIDTSFGQNGVADQLSGTDDSDQFNVILVHTDDTLIAVGKMDSKPVVVRFTSTGQLDTSFNTTGYALFSAEFYDDYPGPQWRDGVVQPDGKIVVVGAHERLIDQFNEEYESLGLAVRYTIDGYLDTDFGNDGQVLLKPDDGDTVFTQIETQSNGKMVVASERSILRLLPNGAIDTTFHSGGDAEVSDLYGLAVDSQDRIITHNGYLPSRLFRYTSNGEVDHSFADTGSVVAPNFTISVGNIAVHESDELLLTFQTHQHEEGLIRHHGRQQPNTAPPAAKPLALIYAVLDNNLGNSWTRLLNNIEAGVRDGMHVRLLIDGPGQDDVYIYDIMYDSNPFCPSLLNPSCDGRYAENINFWRFNTENTAHPDTLYQFLTNAFQDYSDAEDITLSLVGHGSGWSANVLPGQPSIWRDQSDTVGGMLWDDHPGAGQEGSRSLSTRALGQALQWAGAQGGQQIDLLYLDGCSMGMLEVAYELRNSTRFLLASPNIDWASFNYDALLPEISGLDGQDLGKRWLEIEAAQLRTNPGHPFTLSLTDLSKIYDVAGTTSNLSTALSNTLPDERDAIQQAFTESDRFDSNYDGILDQFDAYTDLRDFANQLKQILSSNIEISEAAQELDEALLKAILAHDHQGGEPWVYSDQVWQWDNFSGLGVYLPLGQDETRRQLFYNNSNLDWATDTTWDEFLVDYWSDSISPAAHGADIPTCYRTTQGCEGLANQLPTTTDKQNILFLPLITR